jgi:hypothetical protein
MGAVQINDRELNSSAVHSYRTKGLPRESIVEK